MGTSTLQPLTLVCAEEKPKFYTVEFDISGLKVLRVEISLEWAMLIAYYRKGMKGAEGTAIYERFANYADALLDGIPLPLLESLYRRKQ